MKEAGARSVTLVCLVSAPEGIERVHSEHPDVRIDAASGRSRAQRAGLHRPGARRRGRPSVRNQVRVETLRVSHLGLCPRARHRPPADAGSRPLCPNPRRRRRSRGRRRPRPPRPAARRNRAAARHLRPGPRIPAAGRDLQDLLGAAVATTVGAIDDFRGLPWWGKLGGQVWPGPLRSGSASTSTGSPSRGSGAELPDWFSGPATLVWIVAIMNMVNFLDGMDGLAVSICAIMRLDLRRDRPLARSPGGSAAGGHRRKRLRRDRFTYPARIFMGDSGALLLGFLLATLAVEGLVKTAALATLVLPLLMLAIPIIDTSFVVAKRMKYRQPLYEADRTHLHHRFLNIGFSQARAVAYMYLVRAPRRRGTSDSFPAAETARGGRWDVSNAALIHARHAGPRRGGRVALHRLPARDRQARADPRIRRREGQARSERGAAWPTLQASTVFAKPCGFGCYKSGMLASDGTQFSPVARPGRSGCGTGRNHGGRHRRGALVGWAAGSCSIQALVGALVGIPAGSSPCTAATAESSRERRLGNAWTRPTSHLPKLMGGMIDHPRSPGLPGRRPASPRLAARRCSLGGRRVDRPVAFTPPASARILSRPRVCGESG